MARGGGVRGLNGDDAVGSSDARTKGLAESLRQWLPVLLIAGGIVFGALLVGSADPQPADIRLEMGLVVSWLASMLLFIGGTVAVFAWWRLTRDARVGWLAAIATVGTTHMADGALRLYERVLLPHLGFGVYADAATALICLVLVRCAIVEAPLPRIGPLALGLMLGLAVVLLHVLLLNVDPVLPPIGRAAFVRGVAFLCAVAAIVLLVRHRGFGATLRNGFVVAALLALASRMLGPVGVLQDNVFGLASLSLALVATATFCVEAVRRLVRARTESALVDQQVAGATITESSRAEQLHELRASLAGVAEAVGLLARAEDDDMVPDERRRLTRMLDAEVHRLARLVDTGGRVHTSRMELDPVLEPLVVSRRLVGQRVDWTPTGCRAVADADAVAVAVNALLVNAAVHAPGAPVAITVSEGEDVTRIRVADAGPGVPAELRSTIFTRGGRAGASPGEGLGLHVARSLAAAQGGLLHLAEGESHGAVFDLVLPAHDAEGTP